MFNNGIMYFPGLIHSKHGDMVTRDKYGGHPPRQKRVRTSFKHTQLRTMKSYFAVNHNPDAKDLKELAKKTQLSKRVLQVLLPQILMVTVCYKSHKYSTIK